MFSIGLLLFYVPYVLRPSKIDRTLRWASKEIPYSWREAWEHNNLQMQLLHLFFVRGDVSVRITWPVHTPLSFLFFFPRRFPGVREKCSLWTKEERRVRSGRSKLSKFAENFNWIKCSAVKGQANIFIGRTFKMPSFAFRKGEETKMVKKSRLLTHMLRHRHPLRFLYKFIKNHWKKINLNNRKKIYAEGCYLSMNRKNIYLSVYYTIKIPQNERKLFNEVYVIL